MLQMSKLADSMLHDKRTLICACHTLVLISSSSSSSSSRATGCEFLDVCDSLLQLLGCINDLQDQGKRANVFCTPTRCRQATQCQSFFCYNCIFLNDQKNPKTFLYCLQEKIQQLLKTKLRQKKLESTHNAHGILRLPDQRTLRSVCVSMFDLHAQHFMVVLLLGHTHCSPFVC